MTLDASHLEHALQTTGECLAASGTARTVSLYLVGGAAGLLSGWLAESRATADVDVATVKPRESWDAVCQAARQVARELDLPETWLNDKCQMYAWCLPLGWQERCTHARTYGPLELWLLAREDFIGAKVVSAPSRPQDIEDLLAIKPTEQELTFADKHIDRLAQESLHPDQTFNDARAILRTLRTKA